MPVHRPARVCMPAHAVVLDCGEAATAAVDTDAALERSNGQIGQISGVKCTLARTNGQTDKQKRFDSMRDDELMKL